MREVEGIFFLFVPLSDPNFWSHNLFSLFFVWDGGTQLAAVFVARSKIIYIRS